MKHWTEVDFKHWLYGLKDPDAHVEQCAECREEMQRLVEQRRRIQSAVPEVSEDFLAGQRRNIYRRLEEPAPRWAMLRWALSAATLVVVALGLTLEHFHQPAPPVSDEQLFSDLSVMEQSAEPKAIQPIHSLFEE